MIREFWEKHPDCEHQFTLWHKEVVDAKWNDPRDNEEVEIEYLAEKKEKWPAKLVKALA